MNPLFRLASLAGGALLLLWPAFLNGYPIVFSDTGALLDMGLLPTMGWDKPFVYGPLLAALSLRLTLWLPMLAQGLLLSYVLWQLLAAYDRQAPARHLLLCATLAALTAAPWFAATLLPDALTPIAALALVLAAAPIASAHRNACAAIAAVAIAAHLSHLVLAAALIAALALLRRRIPWRPLASLAAALLFLLASNWIGHGRPSISPYGSIFALARLIGDGPARDYLDRTCPASGYELCRWRAELTGDSDQFLWDPASPFWADPTPLPEFAAQAGRIVAATVADYPWRVLRDAYRNGAHQLVRNQLGDTLVSRYLPDTVRPRLARSYPPAELDRYDSAGQSQSTLAAAAAPLVPIQQAALIVGLAGAAALLLAGLRRPSAAADLAALLLVAVAANALATGALSTVHDRYGARLAWIVLLPPLLALLRLMPAPQPPPATSAPAPRNPAPASR